MIHLQVRPTLREIMDATLKVVGISRKEYDATKDTRRPKVIDARRLFGGVALACGYNRRHVASFTKRDVITVSHHFHQHKAFLAIYRSEREQVAKIKEILNYEL